VVDEMSIHVLVWHRDRIRREGRRERAFKFPNPKSSRRAAPAVNSFTMYSRPPGGEARPCARERDRQNIAATMPGSFERRSWDGAIIGTGHERLEDYGRDERPAEGVIFRRRVRRA